ncbi:MAG: c-type cytochrome [Granulosicoccus sp.]
MDLRSIRQKQRLAMRNHAFSLSQRLLCCLALVSPTVMADDLAKAGSVYKQLCAHCHGIGMVNPGTSSYDLRKFPLDQKKRFYSSVLEGKGSMPAWGDILAPGEIDLLWHYVSTRAGTQPPPEPGDDEQSNVDDGGTLRVCLARNGGAMSAWRSSGGAGLDYALSAWLADKLDRELQLVWYEGEQEKESSPYREHAALLSTNRCDLVPGHMLYEGNKPIGQLNRAALPYSRNRAALRQPGEQVDLQPLMTSEPYARIGIAVVVQPEHATRHINAIADLEGLVVGIEQGTLTGALTRAQLSPSALQQARTFKPGAGFLWRMEQGEFDAAVTTTAAYDFHRRQSHISELVLLDYRYSLGLNIAYAALSTSSELVARVNELLDSARNEGTIAQLANQEGLSTYSAPERPWIQPLITRADLMASSIDGH